MSSGKSIKKRNWAFICYPESLPSDWLDIIKQSGIPCAISPLHDNDLNADGEIKKAHYHVILCFDGPTTYNNVLKFCDSLCAPAPKALESVRGYYRYLTHKDNPDKAQYNESDIQELNGFAYRDFVEMTKTEVIAISKQIQQLIRDANILEYSDLLDLLLDSDMSDAYDVATSHTLLFGRYIDSRRNKQKAAAEGLPSGNLGAAACEGGGDK